MNSPNTPPHDAQATSASSGPKFQPIGAIDRRVLGVLIEKAKTTPDAYPLSANALRSGCNQKSNRYPQMDLDESDIEDAMERLRLVGAAVVIQGGHRVDKMRHLAYEWLGVDKTEIAVMAELLLRVRNRSENCVAVRHAWSQFPAWPSCDRSLPNWSRRTSSST